MKAKEIRKVILLLVLIGSYSISFSQIDYSIFLQKKISKKEMKGFTNLSKFKKFVSSECVDGDCENGESIIKILFLKDKYPNYKYLHTVLIAGNFKNGKLNGQGGIYYYTVDYYSTGVGIYKQQKIPDFKKTPYLEFVEGDFKNNIVTEGVYGLHQEAKSYSTIKYGIDKSVLTNAYLKELPPLVYYFKKYTYNYNESQSIINFQYQGIFNSLDFLEQENALANFEEVFIKFEEGKYNYFKYTITPSNQKDVYNLSSYSNLGFILKGNPDQNKLTTTITIKDDACLGCDITEQSSTAGELTKRLEKQKQDKIDETINRAKSFVGHFIQGTYLAYVSDYNRVDGCITALVYPFRERKKGEYPQSFHDDCDHKNYKIIPNAIVCPNCQGWGTQSTEIVNIITNYWVDDNGVRHDEGTTVGNSGKYTDVGCTVCGGDGVLVVD